MKKIAAIIIIAILLVALIPAEAVLAEQPNGHHTPFDVEGNILVTQREVVDYDTVGTNLVANIVEKGSSSGTLIGTWENEYQITVSMLNGDTAMIGESIWTVTVDKLPGTTTIQFYFTGKYYNSAMTIGLFSGESTIISGTGALSHLRGTMDLDGGFGIPGKADWFTYSGTLYFEPHIEQE